MRRASVSGWMTTVVSLARLHHLVEVADRAMARRQRERPVVPARAVGVEQPAAHQVGRRHVLVAGQCHQRAAELPGHVLHEACLAAAGRPLEDERQAVRVGDAGTAPPRHCMGGSRALPVMR